MYVLDTDVISRTSLLSQEGDKVSCWLMAHAGLTFVSAATLAEINTGIGRLRLRGATRQAEALSSWIETVMRAYRGRVIEMGIQVGLRTGEMLARADKAGSAPGFVDACIAATADVRGFEVVTFNTRDFGTFGVPHRRPDARRPRP